MQQQDTKRFTVKVGEDYQSRLAALAKEFKLSQGEVIETLLDCVGMQENAVKRELADRREQKVNSRTSPWAVYQRERAARLGEDH